MGYWVLPERSRVENVVSLLQGGPGVLSEIRPPVGSGCAPMSISVPQPLLVYKNIMEFNDFSYTKVIKCYLPLYIS